MPPLVRPRRALRAARSFVPCLLASLAAASCAGPRPVPADPVTACNQAAENDPVVHEIRIKQLSGTYQDYLFERDYKQAFNLAVDRCLAAKGLGRPGGVQPIRRD